LWGFVLFVGNHFLMEKANINTTTLKLTMSIDANVIDRLKRHDGELPMETMLDRFGCNKDIQEQYYADMKQMKEGMHKIIDQDGFATKEKQKDISFSNDMIRGGKRVIQQPAFYNGLRAAADAMIRMIQIGSHIGLELFPRTGEREDDKGSCCLTRWASLLARKLLYECYDH
jgi:hypothetical protein